MAIALSNEPEPILNTSTPPYRWAYLGIASFALVLFGLYTYLYSAGSGTEIGPAIAGTALAVLLSLVAANQTQHGIRSAILAVVAISVVFLGIEASIDGSVWLHAVAGSILIAAFSLLVFATKPWWGIAALLSFNLLLFGLNELHLLPALQMADLLNRLDPAPGFNSIRILAVQYLLPLSALLVLGYWAAVTVFLRVRNTIRRRLMFSFVTLAVLTAGIVMTMSGLVSLVTGERVSITQLEQISTAHRTQIDTWMDGLTTTLSLTVENLDTNRRLLSILLLPELSGSAEYLNTRSALQADFRKAVDRSGLYEDISLLDLQGDMLVNTRSGDPHLIMTSEWEILQPGLEKPFITSMVEGEASSRSQLTLLSSVPVLSPGGEPLGLLVGRVRLDRLYEILNQHESLGSTGEQYLVDDQRRMLTPSRFDEWQAMIWRPLHTQGASGAAGQRTGSGSYIGYRNTPVLGTFQWIPDLGVGLLTEQAQSEAFRTVYLALAITALISLLVILLAGFGSVITARGIATPLTRLASTASRIAGGEVELTADTGRQDEIGELALAFNHMTGQLRGLISNLEERVRERTNKLEQRAGQIQAASQIARDVARSTNLDDLLNRAVELVRDRFGYSHAGIFLADEKMEYAVLRSATGEAGREMLARGHRLKIGEVGIVGYVVGSGAPRIALDVGSDSVHFRNPLLPHTRSEMALPLRAGDEIIGALDVQSNLPAAFSDEDIQVLQTMADQLAVAIQNTRLLEKLQRSLHELESTYQQTTRDSWQDFLNASHRVYSYRIKNSVVETGHANGLETGQAVRTGKTVLTQIQPGDSGQKSASLAVPILLRGQVLGALTFNFDTPDVSPEMVHLIESATGRLAVALENARLLEEIQIRSDREHLVGEMSSKIRATTTIDGILRTAVTELGRVMDVSEVMIQLQGDR